MTGPPVVFDVDDHPNLADAKSTAEANGIRLAISNPCFELWLLLHFRDGPGPLTVRQVAHMLRAQLPKYQKKVDYATDFLTGYQAAVRRSRQLDQTIGPGGNPTTGVWRLTQDIQQS